MLRKLSESEVQQALREGILGRAAFQMGDWANRAKEWVRDTAAPAVSSTLGKATGQFGRDSGITGAAHRVKDMAGNAASRLFGPNIPSAASLGVNNERVSRPFSAYSLNDVKKGVGSTTFGDVGKKAVDLAGQAKEHVSNWGNTLKKGFQGEQPGFFGRLMGKKATGGGIGGALKAGMASNPLLTAGATAAGLYGGYKLAKGAYNAYSNWSDRRRANKLTDAKTKYYERAANNPQGATMMHSEAPINNMRGYGLREHSIVSRACLMEANLSEFSSEGFIGRNFPTFIKGGQALGLLTRPDNRNMLRKGADAAKAYGGRALSALQNVASKVKRGYSGPQGAMERLRSMGRRYSANRGGHGSLGLDAVKAALSGPKTGLKGVVASLRDQQSLATVKKFALRESR